MAAYENESLRAFGLAGQAVVYYLQNDREALIPQLHELEKMAGGKLDPQQLDEKLSLDPRMIKLIRAVIEDAELSQK